MRHHKKSSKIGKQPLNRLRLSLDPHITIAPVDSAGSTLVLIPTMVMVAVLFCCIVIDSAALSIFQLRTDHLAADSALLAARSLSQEAFFTSGKLIINQSNAENQVSSYLGSASHFFDYRVSDYYLSASGSVATVLIVAQADLPITLPNWLRLNSVTLSATARADEVASES